MSTSSANLKKVSARSSSKESPARKALKTKTGSSRLVARNARTGKPASPAKVKIKRNSSAKRPPEHARTPESSKRSPRLEKRTPERTRKPESEKRTSKHSRSTVTTKLPAKSKPGMSPSKPGVSAPKKQPVSAARNQQQVSVPRQSTPDEASALKAFERAHKEFKRGHFREARALFVTLVEKHSGVSEVTARARTYLAVVDTRLSPELPSPVDAENLYDRGVIELNRGEFVAAQEMFERALSRDSGAAHIHYGLAATRARLGSTAAALESLERALSIQPKLRVRVQHDQDFTFLRNDPEFQRIISAYRA